LAGTKTTLATANSADAKWWVVDASDKVVGRLASDIAMVLMGKHKPLYTPHLDTGDYVIVLNAAKVKFTAVSGSKRNTLGLRVTPVSGLSRPRNAATRDRN